MDTISEHGTKIEKAERISSSHISIRTVKRREDGVIAMREKKRRGNCGRRKGKTSEMRYYFYYNNCRPLVRHLQRFAILCMKTLPHNAPKVRGRDESELISQSKSECLEGMNGISID